MMKILQSVVLLAVCLLFYDSTYAEAPVISQLSPADNSTSASTTSLLGVFFDQPIQLGEGNITIRRQSDGSVFQVIDVTEGDVTIPFDNVIQISHDALALATSYYVLIDAGAVTNLSGEPFTGISDPSRWNFTTGCGVAPGNIAATNVTDVSATLSWNPINGASGYDIQIGTGDIINVTSSSYQAVNLTPDSPYSFKVRTRCANGTFSVWSKAVNFTTNKACGETPPSNLRATNVSNQSATLSWTALTGVLNYEIYVDGVGNFITTTNTLTLVGLEEGERYHASVRTLCDSTVYSPWTKVIFTTKVQGCEAVPPTGLVASGITPQTATLAWNPVVGAVGYDVYIDGVGNFSTTNNNIDLTGLPEGERLHASVRSKCSEDLVSSWASVVFTTLVSTCVAEPPTGLGASEVGFESALLSWDPVEGAMGYEVYVDGVGTFSTTATSYNLAGLPEGERVHASVKSKCSEDLGSSWTTINFTTLLQGCEVIPPTGLIASNITSESATLSWDGVTGAISYDVYVDGVGSYTTNSTSIELTGLTGGERFHGSVRSRCSEDLASSWTKTVFTTLVEGCQADRPDGLVSSNVTSNSAVLNWNPVPGAVGYDIYVTGKGYLNTTGTTLTLTDLPANQRIYWSVRSKCSEDLSSSWTKATFVTQPATVNQALTSVDVLENSITTLTTEASIEQELEVTLYPNPTADELNISLRGRSEVITSILVMNQNGVKVRLIEGLNSDFETLPLAQFGSGLYLIKVIIDNEVSIVRKVLVN